MQLLLLFLQTLLLSGLLPAEAKSVSEAVSDMSSVQDTDPNGFTLMVVCIGLIVTVALTLIGFTVAYMVKSKRS